MKPAVVSFALIALLAAAGCSLPQPQADAVRHFTLSDAAAGPAAADAVSVRPVRLAGHLRSRAMAVRISANEVIYLEDIRWAESLDEAIAQVLRHRLRQIGGGASVTVQIQRCELVRPENNTVQLSATYTISPASGEVRSGAFNAAPKPWDGKDYSTLVTLLHEEVAELAESIAQTMEQK